MHRTFTYDKTIQKNCMYNLEVFIEDDDVKPGIVSYLDGLGYDLGTSIVYVGGVQHIDYDRLSMNPLIQTYHGQILIGACNDRSPLSTWRDRTIEEMHRKHDEIIANYYKTIEDPTLTDEEKKIETAIHEQYEKMIICDDNTELFKILAAYRNDTDLGKMIYYKDPIPAWWDHLNCDGEKRTDADRFWRNCQWENFNDCTVPWVKERCILLNNYEDVIKYMKF